MENEKKIEKKGSKSKKIKEMACKMDVRKLDAIYGFVQGWKDLFSGFWFVIKCGWWLVAFILSIGMIMNSIPDGNSSVNFFNLIQGFVFAVICLFIVYRFTENYDKKTTHCN